MCIITPTHIKIQFDVSNNPFNDHVPLSFDRGTLVTVAFPHH